MKEKAEILQQLETLNSIKDEMTLQLSSLSSELEKEKSRVHYLENELQKSKVSASLLVCYRRSSSLSSYITASLFTGQDGWCSVQGQQDTLE